MPHCEQIEESQKSNYFSIDCFAPYSHWNKCSFQKRSQLWFGANKFQGLLHDHNRNLFGHVTLDLLEAQNNNEEYQQGFWKRL